MAAVSAGRSTNAAVTRNTKSSLMRARPRNRFSPCWLSSSSSAMPMAPSRPRPFLASRGSGWPRIASSRGSRRRRVDEQVDARQVGRGGARLREVGQGRLDRGHAVERLGRRAGLGDRFGGRAVELHDPQAVGPEGAQRGVQEVGARVVEAAQRGPLLAQHVGVVARLDGQVGQLPQRDRAVEVAAPPRRQGGATGTARGRPGP